MNASKAKRRLLRWHRYIKTTHSMPSPGRAGYHTAHALAYWNYMNARRSAPRGIRVPWTRLTDRGDS